MSKQNNGQINRPYLHGHHFLAPILHSTLQFIIKKVTTGPAIFGLKTFFIGVDNNN